MRAAPWCVLPAALLWPGRAGTRLREDPPPWGWTLALGCLPLIGLGVVIQVLLLEVFPPPIPPEGVPRLAAWGWYVAGVMLAGALGLAWLASLLADAFDGRSDLGVALAGVGLAFVPWTLARVLAPLPWSAWLVPPLFLWGLWLTYQVWGNGLRLKSGRPAHLFACCTGTLLLMVAVGWQLRDLIPGAAPAVRMGRLWLL